MTADSTHNEQPQGGRDTPTGRCATPSPGGGELQPAARTVRRWAGYLIGAGLLIAGLVPAVRGGDWSALAEAPRHLVIGLLGLVAVNLVLTGRVFSLVTRPFEQAGSPVGGMEMQGLIAASTLLNYLPMRAGLVGRAAYLKHQHGIGYRNSAIILAIVMGVSTAVYALGCMVALYDITAAGRLLIAHVFFASAVPAGVAVIVMLGMRIVHQRARAGVVESAATAVIPRAGELCATAGRLWLVFAVIGHRIDMREAIVLASCGMFITLVGLTPNGLGLREWFYGLIAASGFFGGDVQGGLELGLTAAMVDRAAEAMVVLPAGLVSGGYLRRKMRRRARDKAQMQRD